MSSLLLYASMLLATPNPIPAPAAQVPAQPTTGQITIFRTKGWVGSLVGHVFTVDGQRLAKLRPGNVITVELPAGTYTVCTMGKELCVEGIELAAGTTHYIVDTADARSQVGAVAFSIHLFSVSPEDARGAYDGFKIVAPEAGFKVGNSNDGDGH
jgi:hypothetical protein